MNGPAPDLRALAREGHVHFMGAGGAGMCALAELLLRRGGRVSGCDVKRSRSLDDLEALGARILVGHDAAHVLSASALVVTSAVPADHPELEAAHDRGIPVLKRAAALGALVNPGTVVAVAGTHGKTTTTALATQMLAAADMDPTGFVGGRVAGWGGNLRLGGSELFVVEADEYDRSFHTLTPDVAVVTNLEADHLDIYGSLEGVREGFRTFLDGVREGGRIVACADDGGAAALLPAAGARGYSYGLSAGSMLRAVDVTEGPDGTRCGIVEEGHAVARLHMPLGGLHNLRNALGAAAAARHLGASWDAISEAVAAFDGVGRRFQRLGTVDGVTVVDDYAHHPTEIEATLQAARAAFPGRRLVVAFQPHLYTRTRDFAREFGQAVAAADVVWITDVFPAREQPIAGVDGALVAEHARDSGGAEVRYHAEVQGLAEPLAAALVDGDVLFTLGAGSVEHVGPRVLQHLEARVHA